MIRFLDAVAHVIFPLSQNALDAEKTVPRSCFLRENSVSFSLSVCLPLL